MPDDEELYELAEAEDLPERRAPAPTSTPSACPACGVRMRPGARLCVGCGWGADVAAMRPERDDASDRPESVSDRAMRRARIEDERAAEAEAAARFRTWTLPLIVLAAGAALALFNILALVPAASRAVATFNGFASWGEWALEAAVWAGLWTAFYGVTITGGVLLTVVLLGAAYGSAGELALKVAAASITTAASFTFIDYALLWTLTDGAAAALIVQIVLKFLVLAAVLFTVFDGLDSTEFSIITVTIIVGFVAVPAVVLIVSAMFQ